MRRLEQVNRQCDELGSPGQMRSVGYLNRRCDELDRQSDELGSPRQMKIVWYLDRQCDEIRSPAEDRQRDEPGSLEQM
ncbi:hypothetical protein NDU88_006965 [Pleurodeles waltl]|uniref:Uncharacterized protein n=1 Tax=Pleurodeles waltl TaxID=8319 RepID=A0AAV7LQN6_PLEWA|nr:hypothetical protein NDU88_006965 [Pleurodeles waltl]